VSVFYKNTRRVLSYDVLRQQKTGVMTQGVVSGGGGLTYCPAYNVEPVTNTSSSSEQRTPRRVRRSPPSVAAFSQFATRRPPTVDHTVDLYAAKPYIRPESRFCQPHLHSTPPLVEFPSEYRHPVWYEKKLELWSYPMVKKFRRYVYSF